jgi:hypothetical protein
MFARVLLLMCALALVASLLGGQRWPQAEG